MRRIEAISPHDQKWLGDQGVRADRNAHGVQNLHQHQYDQKLIQYAKNQVGVGDHHPLTPGVPEQFARARDGYERRERNQNSKDSQDGAFGRARVIAEMFAYSFVRQLGRGYQPQP